MRTCRWSREDLQRSHIGPTDDAAPSFFPFPFSSLLLKFFLPSSSLWSSDSESCLPFPLLLSVSFFPSSTDLRTCGGFHSILLHDDVYFCRLLLAIKYFFPKVVLLLWLTLNMWVLSPTADLYFHRPEDPLLSSPSSSWFPSILAPPMQTHFLLLLLHCQTPVSEWSVVTDTNGH